VAERTHDIRAATGTTIGATSVAPVLYLLVQNMADLRNQHSPLKEKQG